MRTDSIEFLGLIAGFVGAFAYAPQALKIWRDKSARDVSALSYSMVLAGNILWIGYGVLRGAPSIIIWNVVAALIATFVLTLKATTRGSKPLPRPASDR